MIIMLFHLVLTSKKLSVNIWMMRGFPPLVHPLFLYHLQVYGTFTILGVSSRGRIIG